MMHLGKAQDFTPEYQAREKAYLRAEYEATQAWFKERGITHVSLFRGIELDAPEGRTTVQMQPASSWTTSYDTAYDFASTGPDPKVLLTRVPVEQVLSTCVTGRGCLHETEVILLGKPTRVQIVTALERHASGALVGALLDD
jgi:hypothetical protein